MAISSPINMQNISSGIRSLKLGLSRTIQFAINIKRVIFNRTAFKKQTVVGRRNLQNRRSENILRRDQEDVLESTGVGGIFKRAGSIATESAKGFLGRILDFITTMLAGWLLYNLPTILITIQNLITRIQNLFKLLNDFIGNVVEMFKDFGKLFDGVIYDITHLDFLDTQKKVQNAMKDLESTFGIFHDQFKDGFELFTTPLGEGPGEQPIPETGTNFATPPVESQGGGAVTGIHKQALDIISKPESGGDYNAMNNGNAGDRPGGSKKWLGKNLTDMTIGEVKDFQNNKNKLWAAGKYQIIPKSLPSAQAKAKLKDSDMFDKNNQDLLAIGLLKSQGPGAWTPYSHYTKEQIAILYKAKYAPLGKSSQQSSNLESTKPSSSFAPVTGLSGDSQGNRPLSVPYSPFKPGSGTVITSGKGMRWGRQHKGYDISAKSGTPLYAYFPGKVTHIGLAPGSGYGNWVVWKDDIYGAYHFFGHMLNAPPVRVGQVIAQGTLLGYVGSTGSSTGPHLHWEISNTPPSSNGQFNSYEDPGSWLRKHPLTGSESSRMQAPQAQILPMSQPGQNVNSITSERRGQQIVYIDDRQPSIPSSPGSRGGGQVSSQSVPEDGLNSLIKMQMLLDLAYT